MINMKDETIILRKMLQDKDRLLKHHQDYITKLHKIIDNLKLEVNKLAGVEQRTEENNNSL